MNSSKQRVQNALNHEESDKIPVDFGATSVTGIHCRIVEALREHYGLERKPVRVIEPFQMLGKIEPDLQEIIGVDCQGVLGPRNMFDTDESELHEQVTPWGQKVLISKGIDLTPDANGDVHVYAKGDRTFPPSAVMPSGCYFINAVERQDFVDDSSISPEDNMEEYGPLSDADLQFFKERIFEAAESQKAVVASFGGTALGDVAFIPGMGLPVPKGIRSVSEWYMSTILRQDYIHSLFDRQTDLAIQNYRRLWDAVGDKVDVVFTCGTDFGTQNSQFCSVDTYMNLWHPYYKRLNDWIHKNTTWKIFKHSCGAVYPIIPCLIESGFDILNPVQINAKDMDPRRLKEEFGAQVTFWGGGIDTQHVLPQGTPGEIRDHVMKQCEIFGKDGGFIFNAVHNIQANVPLQNVVAMIETINQINK